jgi:glycosyltransferase involved in cell wall biosynthesis
MATAPTVTVIVPTYNNGRFIAETIDSILGQTRVPEQILIIDDGSTDETERVVNSYADLRIQYQKQPNAGVSAARNTGLSSATGDFITFLDGDDRWLPTFVERMREFLIADPRAVCAFANFVRFEYPSGKLLRDQFSYYPELRARDLHHDIPTAAVRGFPKPWAFRSLVCFGEIPSFPVVMMFRRDRISDMRFDTSLRVCEDTHFALRAFLRGSVLFTSEVLCEVRRHEDNATRDYQSISLHKLAALKALQPCVLGDADLTAYRDRLIKAHIDVAIHQTKAGYVRDGLRTYLDGLCVLGSPMRKVKGSVRVALALPRGFTA